MYMRTQKKQSYANSNSLLSLWYYKTYHAHQFIFSFTFYFFVYFVW